MKNPPSLHSQYRCYFFQTALEQHHGLVAIPFDTGYVVVKLALIISSLYFFVLFRLWHVNSIGKSCKEAIQSIIMQLLNQGGTVEKVIKTTRDNRYFSRHGISLAPHLNPNPIPFHSFALGKILIDRCNLLHCHIYTNI